jgi:hypothetical protein
MLVVFLIGRTANAPAVRPASGRYRVRARLARVRARQRSLAIGAFNQAIPRTLRYEEIVLGFLRPTRWIVCRIENPIFS